MKPALLLMAATLLCSATLPIVTKAQPPAADTSKHYADEKAASFPGGIEGWRKYLEGNLHYPKKAIKKSIQGVVRIQMVVDAKGKVTEVQALNDPGGGLAAEAERVVKDGPNWIPAFQNGRNVTYRFVQTITFQLE
jgi:periplasmic protein TonB